jgi:hypothetical protein
MLCFYEKAFHASIDKLSVSIIATLLRLNEKKLEKREISE